MNYAGTFGNAFTDDATVSTEHLTTGDSASASHDTVIVPDAHLLFAGDFSRLGSDLVLSKDGHEFVISDYFRGEKRAALASPDGANLSGNVVEALTGHIQYAQAGDPQGAARDIGQVAKLVGTVTAIRNGVTVELHSGDRVYKGDVVQAGPNSSVSVTFVDGSVFGLSAGARMVLNEMVYDQAGTANSALISLVRGTITFVAGETAKHGDMKVDTPVATMGIRGTAVLVEIGFEIPSNGSAPPVNFQVLMEPDGHTGSYILYSKSDPSMAIGMIDKSGQVYSLLANGTLSSQPSPALPPIVIMVLGQAFPGFQNGPASHGGGSGSTPATPPDDNLPHNTPNDAPVTIPTTIQIPNKDGTTTTVNIPVTATALHNSPPTISVQDITTDADKFSFNIGSRVTITDPDATNAFHDVAVPYVPGTGKIVSALGPSVSIENISDFVTINPLTGAVSYAAGAFGFLKDNEHVVVTIAFDSKSGPDMEHEIVHLTIDGGNDAPVVTASLSLHQGVPVVLTTSDIVVADPDSNSFTFTADVTHGSFQVETDDNVWTDLGSGSFSSADLAAGHVRFVDDGSLEQPTILLIASDGIDDSAAFPATVNFIVDDIILNSTGLSINISSGGATNGFSFPDTNTGNVTTPGTREDRIALGYHIGGVETLKNAAPMLGENGFTPISSISNTDGSTSSVTTVLGAENGVTLTQTISLGSNANYFTTTIDIHNGSGVDIDGVRFLRNFDPDQDVDVGGSYSTNNDVVQNPDNSEPFAIVSATGQQSGTTISMIGLGDAWRGSVYGFTNTDPYADAAYDHPVDPNGALDDLSLSLTYDFGTIACGQDVQITYITTDNKATDGDNALFGTSSGDIINGLAGDDLLIGLGGADTFIFAKDSGHDTIYDFTPGIDHIDVQAYDLPADFATWATSGALESVDDGTLVHLSENDTVLLKNVSIADLSAANFSGPSHWTNAAGGDFADSSNWDNGIPTSSKDAAIDTTSNSTYIVTSATDQTINGLYLGAHATLDVGNGVFEVQQNVLNAGSIEVSGSEQQAGTLKIDGDVTGTGSATIDGTNTTATLEFGGSSDSNVNFAGSGTLKLDDPYHFTGTISGVTATGVDIQIGTGAAYTVVNDGFSLEFHYGSAEQETGPVLIVAIENNTTDPNSHAANNSSHTLIGTAHNDLFIGDTTPDNFVFAPQLVGDGAVATGGNDTIANFKAGTDTIELDGFTSIPVNGSGNFTETELTALKNTHVIEQAGSDTLIHLDGTDTLLLKNVAVTSLTANDFIVHPGGGSS